MKYQQNVCDQISDREVNVFLWTVKILYESITIRLEHNIYLLGIISDNIANFLALFPSF